MTLIYFYSLRVTAYILLGYFCFISNIFSDSLWILLSLLLSSCKAELMSLQLSMFTWKDTLKKMLIKHLWKLLWKPGAQTSDPAPVVIRGTAAGDICGKKRRSCRCGFLRLYTKCREVVIKAAYSEVCAARAREIWAFAGASPRQQAENGGNRWGEVLQ